MVKYLIIVLIAVNIMACRQLSPGSVNVDSALLKSHTPFGLTIELNGTAKAYFAQNGKPLLSFGGGPGDMMLWLNEDAFDYKRWANWEADFGMNHSRDYPPLSWKGIEVVTLENGGAIENCLFPFDETKPGSRQFDLSKFNDAFLTTRWVN